MNVYTIVYAISDGSYARTKATSDRAFVHVQERWFQRGFSNGAKLCRAFVKVDRQKSNMFCARLCGSVNTEAFERLGKWVEVEERGGTHSDWSKYLGARTKLGFRAPNLLRQPLRYDARCVWTICCVIEQKENMRGEPIPGKGKKGVYRKRKAE